MSFNKYNTRKSGVRPNAPGRYVTAAKLAASPQVKTFDISEDQQQQSGNFNNKIDKRPKVKSYNNGNFKEEPKEEDEQFEEEETDMDTAAAAAAPEESADDAGSEDPASTRPHWMKPKLQGVRKISNKERRRRQNGSLRRLLTPKNALMVLNEIEKGENSFTVEPANTSGQFFKQNNNSAFCAALCSDGKSYKGYGENKMAARNAAAEQAVRDLLLKKMNALLNNETEQAATEEDLPMIQLASFALHKLFTEWECQGHRVPQLRGGVSQAVSDTASDAGSGVSAVGRPKPPKSLRTELPATAANMHPCMLLSHMRPGLAYREVAVEGDRPLNIMFTMEVEVDGQLFTGKACNKREARKAAAREACQTIFNVCFSEESQ